VVSESAAVGSAVGVTAVSDDLDGTDSVVSYSLTDDADGRFQINATTGVVTVADPSKLDYETATSHTVTVEATSSDGSTEESIFTINLTDDTSEFAVGAAMDADTSADAVSESAAVGSAVGVTAVSDDLDGTDTVSYTLTDDAGGRFQIDATTGVVTVADPSKLDYETATSHTVTIQAESSDGSTSESTFTINLTDDTSEFAVGAAVDADTSADAVSESAAVGSAVGVTAVSDDLDGTDSVVSYSLTDDADGRFQINATTGVVTVADPGKLDYETATSHTVTVEATSSDGSTEESIFTINLTDDTSEFAVGAAVDADTSADAVSESAAVGSAVGVTAVSDDLDGTDTVSYTLTDDAGGRFQIDATTGVVTVADPSKLDYETATSHTVTIQAESSDGSTSESTFTINLTDDTSEHGASAATDADTSADVVSESAAVGSAVGVTAVSDDLDGTDSVVSYSLTDDADGRFQINATTGVVTVADPSKLDYETATSHTVTVEATSSDGSTEESIFTINLTDDTSEFAVGAAMDADTSADAVSESAAVGSAVGVTAVSDDLDGTDTVSYTLTDDAGGRFQIDATTGVVTVADPSKLDYETATSHTVTIQAESSDGSTSESTFTINLTDDTSEFAVGAAVDADTSADAVSESAAVGSAVGVTAVSDDLDGTDSVVSYSLTDDADGRFQINATTGVVTVADPSKLDYETATSHTVTVEATSSDGSTEESIFTINLTDDTSEFAVGAAVDADTSADAVSESAAVGSAVGVTAVSDDLDGTDTVSYTLTDDAGGRFQIDATTGVVTVADPSKLDYETATSHTVTVQAESSDGSTSESTFTINVLDNQAPVFSANKDTVFVENDDVIENVVHTAQATDADGDILSYSLGGSDKDAFSIDSETGEVRFVSSPDYETQSNYEFTVTAFDGYLSAVQNVSVDIFNIDELVDLGSAELAGGGEFVGEGLDDTMDGSGSTVSLDLSGGDGDDILTGGVADDILDGGDGENVLNGGAGNDVIISSGLDRVDGGVGVDTLIIGRNADDDGVLSVNLSREWQYTGEGWAYVSGIENVTTGAGEDMIQGNDVANVLDSGDGDDWLYAGGGDDVLIGGEGTDRLFGGDGNDTVVFTSSDDLTVDLNEEWQGGNLNTSEGMDKIIDVENVTTGAGNDILIGNTEANALDGGDGDDILSGGDGDDTLTGGSGADVFRFYASEAMSTDVITDFVVGEDKLELVNNTTDIIGDAVITTDANGSTVTWDELTIVLDVVITKDDINPIIS
jgi:hypothetical protein